jgi:phosphoenolpyruvate-protein phosphotransferase (PTS system enzyme I)
VSGSTSSPRPIEGERIVAGRAACPGFGTGGIYVVRGDEPDGEVNPAQIRPDVAAAPVGAVIASEDLTPAEMLRLDVLKPAAIALSRGSATGHIAVMAHERGLPLLIGLGIDFAALGLAPGAEALVDAVAGELTLLPSDPRRAAFVQRREDWAKDRARDELALPRPAATADGTPISLALAVDELSQLRALNPAHSDGIGLVRTEMLFMNRSAMPGEEAQLALYRILLQWADPRPVWVRTVDPGGGKTLPGLDATPLRGVAFSLAHPDLLRIQLRAMLRAAAYGDLSIVLPMVERPGQLGQVRELLAGCIDALRREGRPFGAPPLVMMVETPAAAERIEEFDPDGYAIGLGDLAALASGRPREGGPGAGAGCSDAPAAVSALVRRVVAHAARVGLPCRLCGVDAADPKLLPGWLALGARAFCVPAEDLGRVKAAIAAVDLRSPPSGRA